MIKYIDSSKTNFIPKIGDYGIARKLDKGKDHTILGSLPNMSPEILNEKDEYSDKSDLFSLGVMIYQLYFNSNPFYIPGNQEEIEKNYNKKKNKIVKIKF